MNIKAVTGLKFDQVRIIAEPGSTLRINLENADEMMHNLLVVKPETRISVVEQAESMENGLENDFTPELTEILAGTPLLGPGEQATIIFDVPEEEGAYPYVCTYPAHGMVMYGVIYATSNPKNLPRPDEDTNIPEPVRNELAASNSIHPYTMEMPTITRLFMPDSSPAAIAVGMEKEQSYTWDAGYSHLRYVWSGGYIDATEQWDAKASEVAEVVGEIYYRNKNGFPFRVSDPDSIPEPDFKGYELADGYPKFRYTMGDIMVEELIVPAEITPGFKIEYQLENVSETVWYALSEDPLLSISFSKGTLTDSLLRLSPDEAREFTITIVQ